MDSNYRTIPERDSRGICGWSMGGRGTIKMGMEYSDVFSAAYALSPAVLTLCVDWGKHDQWPHIPVAGRMFSEKLEALGIEHYAEEYIGNHWNKILSYDGRMVNSVLPFFNANLKFQEE
jgi:S-formylglutathione hydrolase FrmB